MNNESSATRRSILAAAAVLIRNAGSVRELTVRRIIEAAGVNLNAVNYHFGSKDALVREAVRTVIGEYFRERGILPGSTGPGLRKNLARICDFLFDEPVAARLALESETESGGGGESLTGETLTALTAMLCSESPGLVAAEARLRIWSLLAFVHMILLRPEGAVEWLGTDPRDKGSRDRLLAQACEILGIPDSPRGARKPAREGRKNDEA
ncbi:MAG: TetR/AcrR family transcriptional regulator [Treponema sp.]|nr:TetR/AcrR family transcriptional regulator [Treponema sp.]